MREQQQAGSPERQPEPDDVVVTGIGLIAGSVTEPTELFRQLADGVSIIQEHPEHRGWGLPAAVSAHIPVETTRALAAELPEQARRIGASGLLGWHAATQAWKASGLPERLEDDRGGIFVGCNFMVMGPELADLCEFYDTEKGLLDFDSYLETSASPSDGHLQSLPDTMTAALGERFGLTGAIETRAEACAAGAMAIGSGYRRIRSGELDVALVGGAEQLTTYAMVLSFASLGAIAPTSNIPAADVSRPFDKDRSGFVIADAAAFLVLERRSHAEARGAEVLARVAGYAGVAEAVRVTSSERNGASYATCMRAALSEADLAPSDVLHVKAHGTSTQANDECEAAALHSLFGSDISKVPVTSLKSALGHSLGASGPIEVVLSVLSLREQTLLPTLNFNSPDTTTAGLDIVTQAREAAFDAVLSNSFGFGGMNSTLVLTREAP
ncbi:MAG: beta-ketoacyl-[acyl-carrier-protein] synthase family protein [Segniliparus sp.]|uniref:beta-ketoacyl-[acyl-carrier-protein] synthase family protein n=1 Tax=Segniliparus sp. TaxID=2804064 RepID=UPI003F4081B3